MSDDRPAPHVADAPERIWLVAGDIDPDAVFRDLQEVTWCEDQQFDADVPYVRADVADDLQAALHATDVARLQLLADLDAHRAAYGMTVAQRDRAWAELSQLRAELAALQAARCPHTQP